MVELLSQFSLALQYMGFAGRWTPALALLALIAGPGIIINTFRSMGKGEGMAGQDSRKYMVTMNFVSIAVGALITVWGIYYLMKLWGMLL